MDVGQAPPHDDAAEKALFGCLLLDASFTLTASYAAGLAAEHFYANRHRAIWDAAARLASSGKSIDAVALVDAVPEERGAGLVPLRRYLAALVAGVVSPLNARAYADIVVKYARCRVAINAATQAMNAAYGGDLDAATSALRSGLSPRIESERSPIDKLPRTPGTAAWLGSVARGKPGADEARASIPEALRSSFDEALDGSGRYPRPAGVSEGLARSVSRFLGERKAQEPEVLAITRVERHVEPSGRASFTVRVSLGEHEASIARLTGAELLSYSTVCARAVEQGTVLPATSKTIRDTWHGAVEAAMPSAIVTEADPESTISGAVRREMEQAIGSPHRAADLVDLRKGGVLVREGFAHLDPSVLVARLRRALDDDVPTRSEIWEVASALGVRERRPLVEGQRPRLWAFPFTKDADDGGDEPEDGVGRKADDPAARAALGNGHLGMLSQEDLAPRPAGDGEDALHS